MLFENALSVYISSIIRYVRNCFSRNVLPKKFQPQHVFIENTLTIFRNDSNSETNLKRITMSREINNLFRNVSININHHTSEFSSKLLFPVYKKFLFSTIQLDKQQKYKLLTITYLGISEYFRFLLTFIDTKFTIFPHKPDQDIEPNT